MEKLGRHSRGSPDGQPSWITPDDSPVSLGPDAAPQFLPCLDGLRAIAVASVVLFHADVALFKGGWIGVNLFIALSGWLITTGLIRESRNGTLSYGAFVARRVRRLMPAVALLLGGVGLLAMSGALVVSLGGVLGTATWTSNWYQLISQSGYWDQANRSGALDHLWSLAVEEQFYVVWPLIILITMRVRRHRLASSAATVTVLALVGAGLSLAVSLWGTLQHWTVDRLYLGTDTRSIGFLLGAAAAGIVTVSRARRDTFLRLAGPVCGIALVSAVVAARVTEATFLGLMQAIDVACVVVVVWAAGLAGGPLAWGPVRAIGRWSYGIYLWHWPLMLVLEGLIRDPWTRAAVVFGLATLVAAASYRFVEQPLRATTWLQRSDRFRWPRAAVILPALLVLWVPAIVAATPDNQGPPALEFNDSAVATARAAGTNVARPTRSTGAREEGNQAPRSAEHSQATPTVPPGPTCDTVIHLGDSNLGMVRPLFTAAYQAAELDAYIDHANGRSAYRSHDSPSGGTVSTITAFRESTPPTRCWIIQLGTQDAADALSNGLDPTASIDAVVTALHGEPTLWINISLQGEPPFTAEAAQAYNRALATRTQPAPNITIVDWAAIADQRPDQFQPDGIHYTSELYTTLVQVVTAHMASEWTIGRRREP